MIDFFLNMEWYFQIPTVIVLWVLVMCVYGMIRGVYLGQTGRTDQIQYDIHCFLIRQSIK